MFARAAAIVLVIVIGVTPIALAQSKSAARPQPRSEPPRSTGRELKIAMLAGGDAHALDAVAAGLDAAKRHGRITVAVRLASRPTDYAVLIEQLAAATPDLIIGAGELDRGAFRAASKRHPELRFLFLDAELPDAPNVKSVTFRTDEGSFLAGVVAALETKRGRVGFVGAVETPAIKAYECGFETGVRWATKERFLTVRGRHVYIGTTAEAFANPLAGEELSRAMIAQQGADVLYSAAGASGRGVLAAARHANVKAIGVDVDQRSLAPDAVITSMRKRVDRVIQDTVADVRRHAFSGGVTEMNLANGGVDLVLPGRLAASTLKLLAKARAAVVSGEAPACVKEEDRVPAWNFPPRPAAP